MPTLLCSFNFSCDVPIGATEEEQQEVAVNKFRSILQDESDSDVNCRVEIYDVMYDHEEKEELRGADLEQMREEGKCPGST